MWCHWVYKTMQTVWQLDCLYRHILHTYWAGLLCVTYIQHVRKHSLTHLFAPHTHTYIRTNTSNSNTTNWCVHANSHTHARTAFSWIACACMRAVRSSCVYVSRWSDWFALTPTIPERDANKQQQNILCVWINSRHFSISIWYTFPQCSASPSRIHSYCLFVSFPLLQSESSDTER